MFSYKFLNLLGAPFDSACAQLCFDKRAQCLYTPTSNRVMCYRLHSSQDGFGPHSFSRKKATSVTAGATADAALDEEEGEDHHDIVSSCNVHTFPFEARVDVSWFCLRSDGLLAISIDRYGHALIVNVLKGCVVNRIQFRSNAAAEQKRKWQASRDQQHFVCGAAFSPDDQLFAVAIGRSLQIWRAPSPEFCYQLRQLRLMTLHQQTITTLSWSPDSTHLVTGSLDCTVRLWRARGKQQQRQQQQSKRQRRLHATKAAAAEAVEEAEEEEGCETVGLDGGVEEEQQWQQLYSAGRTRELRAEHAAFLASCESGDGKGDRDFKPVAFVAHRHAIKFACFSACLTRIISVNKEGVIIIWQWVPHAAPTSAAPAATAAVALKREKQKRHQALRRRVGVARIINPAARQQRARARRAAEEQDKASCMTEEREAEGSTSTSDGSSSEGEEEAGIGRSEERPATKSSVVNYMEGRWRTAARAFCFSSATSGKSSSNGSESTSSSFFRKQEVTHACTNISPYFQNKRCYSANSAPTVSAAGKHATLPAQYLLVGFRGGVLQLYIIPSLAVLCRVSIGLPSIDSLTLSFDGEWIAAAAAAQTQALVVWEWRSQSYVLRQQTPPFGICSLAFSPAVDAALASGSRRALGNSSRNNNCSSGSSLGLGVSRGILATGGSEGRVKVFDAESGFCFCSFSDHTAAVSAVAFSPAGNALFSASLDGTVRAYDLLRYRQFRIFTAQPGQAHAGFDARRGVQEGAATTAATCIEELPATSIQFSCLAVDSGGELLVAGGSGSVFTAYVWSVQTGKIVDELTGHEGPVAAVAFHPHPSQQGIVLSGSWDGKLLVWDLFGRRSRGGAPESFICPGSVFCMCFDPRGSGIVAVGCNSGRVAVFDLSLGGAEGLLSTLDLSRDLQGGRRSCCDRRARNNWASTAKKRVLGNSAGLDLTAGVNSIAFSSTGELLLVSSKCCGSVFLYEARSSSLVARFILTRNRMLDGLLRELNSKYITEAGEPQQAYDLSDEDLDFNEGMRERQRIQQHLALPGVRSGPLASKKSRVFFVHQVAFSADSSSWAAATSQGLYIYSLDSKSGLYGSFGAARLACSPPPLLTGKVTLGNIIRAVESRQYAKALIFSLVSNDMPTLLSVYEKIPPLSIPLVCSSLAPALLPPLLFFLHVLLSTDVEVGTPHLQLHLMWLLHLLTSNMHVFQGDLAALWAKTREIPQQQERQQRAKANEAFERLTGVSVDLRTLFLMILRQLQQQYANLHASFSSNLSYLAVLNSAALRRRSSSAAAALCDEIAV